jgi:hypothetical protein
MLDRQTDSQTHRGREADLVVSEPSGVEEVLGEEGLGGADLLEEAVGAQQQRGLPPFLHVGATPAAFPIKAEITEHYDRLRWKGNNKLFS